MTRVSDLSCAARPLQSARALMAGAQAGEALRKVIALDPSGTLADDALIDLADLEGALEGMDGAQDIECALEEMETAFEELATDVVVPVCDRPTLPSSAVPVSLTMLTLVKCGRSNACSKPESPHRQDERTIEPCPT